MYVYVLVYVVTLCVHKRHGPWQLCYIELSVTKSMACHRERLGGRCHIIKKEPFTKPKQLFM